ncbi:MAG: hypothetical protein HY816_16015 [Candidatus Wallbacteria bacterium]|nr:hypothetical protein [Candidatus Wallbacteria bacterium]
MVLETEPGAGVSTLVFKLVYDPRRLGFATLSEGPEGARAGKRAYMNGEPGWLTVVVAGGKGPMATGVVASLFFAVPPELSWSATKLLLDKVDGATPDARTVRLEAKSLDLLLAPGARGRVELTLRRGLNWVGVPVDAGNGFDADGLLGQIEATWIAARSETDSTWRVYLPGVSAPFGFSGNCAYAAHVPRARRTWLEGSAWPDAHRTLSLVSGANPVALAWGVPSWMTWEDLARLTGSSRVLGSRPDADPSGGTRVLWPPGDPATAPRVGEGYVLVTSEPKKVTLPPGP